MNTTVIIIMMVCATIIALVAIICDHLFERKYANSSEFMMAKKIIKIHRNYIVGFLGFAVIMLVTAKYGGPKNAIFEYLSFGSTITSLVLSVLAIFVTVQSSSDLYKQFTRIDNATDVMGKSLEKFTEAERKLEATSNIISSQMDNIVEEIDRRLDQRMREFSEQVSSSLNQHSQSVNENFHKEIFKEAFEQASKTNQETWKKWLDGYVNLMSFNGILALYAVTLSLEKAKSFRMSELFKGNNQYVFGILIASSSIGVINTRINDGDTVECLFSVFTKEKLILKIKELLAQFTEVEKQLVNSINQYFGEPLI